MTPEDSALLNAITANGRATREELLATLGPNWWPGNPEMKLAQTLQRFVSNGILRRRNGAFVLRRTERRRHRARRNHGLGG